MSRRELAIDLASDSLNDEQKAAMRGVGCVPVASEADTDSVQLRFEVDGDALPDALEPVLSKAIEIGLIPTRVLKLSHVSGDVVKEEVWSAEPLIQKELGDYFQSFVSLSGCYSPRGGHDVRAGVFHNSGFILSQAEQWYWITAGHVFDHPERGIETLRKSGRISLDRCWLIDSFRTRNPAIEGIPFAYWEYPFICVYNQQQGIDLFAVKLSDNHRSLLEANGIRPLSEANWEPIEIDQFAGFLMCGLPVELEDTKIEQRHDSYDVRTKPVPVVVYCELERDIPDGHQTPTPRFVARIHRDAGDITGMSGGPVFGVISSEPNLHVVALQNSWNSRSRLSFGCPISEVIQRLPK